MTGRGFVALLIYNLTLAVTLAWLGVPDWLINAALYGSAVLVVVIAGVRAGIDCLYGEIERGIRWGFDAGWDGW